MSESYNPYAAPTTVSAPVATLSYRPTSTLVRVLSAILILLAIGDLAAGSLTLAEMALIDDFDLAIELEQPQALGIMIGYLAIALFVLPTYIACIVVFCIWIHRANRNARALGAEGMQFTPGWSVGWFFIPIANLFKPFQAAKEIYRASDPRCRGDEWWQSDVPALFGFWWAAWIITNILGRAEMRLTMSDDPDMNKLGNIVTVANAPIGIAAALLCLTVVRTIHKRQEAKHAGRFESRSGAE